jgi:adenylate cyclase
VLRRVPAIASLAIVDGDGREGLFLSRVDLNPAVGGDRSAEPAVIEARATGVWFGSVTFAGGSEPFMSVAVGAIAARPASSSRRSISSSSGS